ncbi:MAG: hypothetical protein WCI03_06390 [bacterium]
MRRNLLWLLIIAGGCLFASLLHARVFSTGSIDLFNPSSFGKLIYKTLMEINGEKADVSVVACENGLTSLKAVLKVHHDPTLRVVALSTGEEKPVLLVTVAQALAEKEASQARHRLADVPVPSDGVVLGTMRSADTRTTFERLAYRMGKEEAIRFYEQSMERTGWSKLMGAGEGGGFLFYVKGADICVVLVAIQESNGETGITLLHKQGAVN